MRKPDPRIEHEKFAELLGRILLSVNIFCRKQDVFHLWLNKFEYFIKLYGANQEQERKLFMKMIPKKVHFDFGVKFPCFELSKEPLDEIVIKYNELLTSVTRRNHLRRITEILVKESLNDIPKEWLDVLQCLSNEELNNFVVNKTLVSMFVDNTNLCSLPVWPKTLQSFIEKCKYINRLSRINLPTTLKMPQQFIKGLNPKKQHEIIHLAQLIHKQCETLNIKVIVDFGSGLGYVSQLLYYLYGYKVLGLDGNEMNINIARKRQMKIYPTSINHVKYAFYTSTFLRQPFLRLACQEPAERWINMSQGLHDTHAFHVLAKAVLELYVKQNKLQLKKQVRKATRRSQCSSIENYVKDTLLRYTLEPTNETIPRKHGKVNGHEMIENEITELWKHHCQRLQQIEIYTGLQLILQAPAESIVLQDRLCWLREQGLKAIIVPVMNNILSPRFNAIVAQKVKNILLNRIEKRKENVEI
ncbi:hypothetical protein M0802_015922 [Mischocyttarus mexicanus]|nr:hypothetical protein M0802_015922 [Mischocyttarus mexicanus]